MYSADRICAKGSFNLQIIQNNVIIETISENNLVVMGGLQNLVRLLGGVEAGSKIDKIAFGTSALPPSLTDTEITNAFAKNLLPPTFPEPNSIVFSFELSNEDAVGMTIREFGLLNGNNVLCARKIRSGDIVKTNAIRLVGSWKITLN